MEATIWVYDKDDYNLTGGDVITKSRMNVLYQWMQ